MDSFPELLPWKESKVCLGAEQKKAIAVACIPRGLASVGWT